MVKAIRFCGREWSAETDRIDCVNHEVDDLSPLASLTRLRGLSLAVTNPHIDLVYKIRDLAPLGNLDSLEVLELPRTAVDDLAPLSRLMNLRKLDVSRSRVTDLTPLKSLHKLRWLKISSTQVKDLSPLAGLSEITHLDASNTPIADLTPLAELRRLVSLNVRDTSVATLTPIFDLPVIRDAVELDLTGTRVSSLDVVDHAPGLKELWLTETPVSGAELAGLAARRPEISIIR